MPKKLVITTWAILQLRDGFNLSMPLVEAEQEFRARWPEHVFCFPAVKQGTLDPDNPLSMYVLVRPPITPAGFERSQLIAAVLKDPGTRKPLTITDAELKAMAPLPIFPPPGSLVRVTAGDFNGLEGTVVEVNADSCRVLVELWSKQSLLTLAANEFQTV